MAAVPAAAPLPPTVGKKVRVTNPLLKTQNAHQTMAASRHESEYHVVRETIKISKGNAIEPDKPPHANDPGVVYIDVGSGSGGITRYFRHITDAVPNRVKAINRAQNPEPPLKIKCLFLAPDLGVDDALRLRRIPAMHRLSTQYVESFQVEKLTLAEAGPIISMLRAQSPGYRFIFNFSHSFYYMQKEDLRVLLPEMPGPNGPTEPDELFISTHMFEGKPDSPDAGCIPVRNPEYSWERYTDKHGERIRMVPTGSAGTIYDHPDITSALREGYVTYPGDRNAWIASGMQTPGVKDPTFAIGLRETRTFESAEDDSTVSSIFHGVVLAHQKKYKKAPVFDKFTQHVMTGPAAATIRAQVAKISPDQNLRQIDEDLRTIVGTIMSMYSGLQLKIDEVRRLVAESFVETLTQNKAQRIFLGSQVEDLRKTRIALKLHENEGFISRKLAKHRNEDGTGFCAAALELIAVFTNGSPVSG
jgi:hypothetical protein